MHHVSIKNKGLPPLPPTPNAPFLKHGGGGISYRNPIHTPVHVYPACSIFDRLGKIGDKNPTILFIVKAGKEMYYALLPSL